MLDRLLWVQSSVIEAKHNDEKKIFSIIVIRSIALVYSASCGYKYNKVKPLTEQLQGLQKECLFKWMQLVFLSNKEKSIDSTVESEKRKTITIKQVLIHTRRTLVIFSIFGNQQTKSQNQIIRDSFDMMLKIYLLIN